MGGLFSRTVVVDLTTQYSSELKQLETELAALQARKQAQLSLKRRVTRGLVLYGTLAWITILLLCLYVLEFPNRNHLVAKCLKVGPIVGWPLVLFIVKSSVDSYYAIQWRKADARITKLEKSKETKLEDLMAKTNFKATQQLISQFSEKKKPQQAKATGSPPDKQTMTSGPAGMQGRHQPMTPAPGRQMAQTMPTSAFKQAHQMNQQHQHQQQQHVQSGGAMQRPAPVAAPPSSEPLAPASRSSLDKVLDFLLNEGPNNKYALICSSCQGHNGLVREQELGKIRFRCAMCGAFNGPPLTADQQAAAAGASVSSAVPMTPGQHGRGLSTDGGAFTPGPSPSGALAPLTPFAPLSADRRSAFGTADPTDAESEEAPATASHRRAGGRASAHNRTNSSRGEATEEPTPATNEHDGDEAEDDQAEEAKQMRNRKSHARK